MVLALVGNVGAEQGSVACYLPLDLRVLEVQHRAL